LKSGDEARTAFATREVMVEDVPTCLQPLPDRYATIRRARRSRRHARRFCMAYNEDGWVLKLISRDRQAVQSGRRWSRRTSGPYPPGFDHGAWRVIKADTIEFMHQKSRIHGYDATRDWLISPSARDKKVEDGSEA
jgi:hypothetical protein